MTGWTAWTFRIKDTAFRHVQPLSMELVREKAITRVSGYLWWKKEVEDFTGRWAIVIKYNRGPTTRMCRTEVIFDREDEARFWFNQTFDSVFTTTRSPIPPTPKKTPKPKKSKKTTNGLRLV